MSHVLDVESDPESDPESEPRRRRRNPFGILIALILFVALVGVAVVGVSKNLPSFGGGSTDYTGDGTGQVLVTVAAGDSAGAIATELKSKDVVKSREAFLTAAAADKRSKGIQPGAYNLRSQMSALAALNLILDPVARARTKVTIPEGTVLNAAISKIADGTNITDADLIAAAKDPATLGVPAYGKGQLEGFLFPATYDVEPGTTATQVLTTMVARYQQAAKAVDLEARAAAIGRSPYDVLVTASLIEKETAFAPDRAKVARVVYNRLDRGMPLQFDSTVNYLKAEKTARLTLADLKIESAYNTYKNKGLPPTPIDSPGQDALQAALNPADGNYVFFITTSKDGSALFTNDYREFQNAKAKAKAEGVY